MITCSLVGILLYMLFIIPFFSNTSHMDQGMTVCVGYILLDLPINLVEICVPQRMNSFDF